MMIMIAVLLLLLLLLLLLVAVVTTILKGLRVSFVVDFVSMLFSQALS